MRPTFMPILALLSTSFLALPAGAQVINEWVANHTGTDDHEYVEIFGAANTSYTTLWVVQIEGDNEDVQGNLDSAHQVGTTGAGGFWVTPFETNVFHNGTMTLLLVEGFSGVTGTDLDVDNDGTLDVTPWTSVVDSLAVDDGDAGDHTYLTTTVLTPNYDGISSFEPGGASRIPDGVDTDTTGDWVRNDFDLAGIPGESGSISLGEAFNTPGSANASIQPRDPILSELVHDHVGASDTHEYIETYASSDWDYSDHSVLVLDGESSGNPGRIDLVFALGTTNGSGYWHTGFLVDQLDKASFTVLLVEGFSGLAGDDLDAADDGSLDSAPWSTLLDDIAIDSGVAGDLVYSSVVLGGAVRGLAPPGAASRYPYATDTDSAGDWRPNDFDGAGLPGFAGTLASGEVLNTPGRVPQILSGDYYAGIFALDAATLRAALHELIDDHIRFVYTGDATDTWDVLEEADQDPVAGDSILAVYKNETYVKEGGGNSFYNREHTWPRTYGFPDDGFDNMPYTDCHQLMLSNIDYNSQRGSIAFGTCNASCAELTTDLNHGTGGGSGTYPGNSNWATGSGATGTFEVWNEVRGDVARAQLYLDLRYAGGSHGVTGVSEPDLILTDDTGLIVGGAASVAYMGRLSVLLAWHAEDPVDDRERRRNEAIYSYQGNRNPLVDRPEWVSCVFEAECGGIFSDGFESGDLSAW